MAPVALAALVPPPSKRRRSLACFEQSQHGPAAVILLVANGEHFLPLGPPCILTDALPWDLHLLSWQTQLKPTGGSNARLGTGVTPPKCIRWEEVGSHQLQGCHIPSKVLCCLRNLARQCLPPLPPRPPFVAPHFCLWTLHFPRATC